MTMQRLIMIVFFLQPVAFGNWLARIPDVQLALGLKPASLAIAFLGMPLGIILTLPFGSRIVAAMGSRNLITSGFIFLHLVILLPVLAPNLPLLFIALVICGSAVSLVELGLNVSAAAIESHGGRLIMSTCHGFWSTGIGFGSFLGLGLASLGLSPVQSMLGSAVVVMALGVLFSRALPDYRDPQDEQPQQTRFFVLPSKALAGICLFVIGVAMTEGAMGDWAGLYLRDVAHISDNLTGLGYGFFAVFVSAGRFMGDWLKARIGTVDLARLCGVFSLAGALLLMFGTSVPVALACYAMIGFGVSVGFPLSVSAASALSDRSPASSVAILSLVAIGGFLIGPVLIGLVVHQAGMHYGLLALVPILLISLGSTSFLKGQNSA